MFRYTPLALLCSAALVTTLSGCGQQQTSPQNATEVTAASTDNLALWPELTSPLASADTEKRVQQLLSAMTLEQKVAQLIQPDIRWMTVEDMRQYGFGSYLNGGGAYPNDNKNSTAADWVALAQAYYDAGVDATQDGSSIPPMWGTDAVHGHNNVMGATIFPHNIGLGAANNAQLVEAIGKATAIEVAATGINWIFAPTVAVARDDRWGRSYESYSEDPVIVKELGAALVKGIQGNLGSDFMQSGRLIATAKHYLGDGGTENGKDQGNNLDNEADLVRLHAQGYISSLDAGVQTVMASFNSWHGDKMHGHQYLLTTVLKQRMGFDGLVVGDWNGHGQLPGCTNTSCAAAINAGVDILMAPEDGKALYKNTLAQAKAGEIPAARIDDAVSRILRVKIRAGLFEKGNPAQSEFAGKQQWIGHADHQAIAAQAVRESLVLLKNNNQLLPLAPKQKVLVTGDGADNIGKQSGGWTLTWQGTGNTNADFPNGRSIFSGIKQQVEAAQGSVELSVDGSYQQKPDVAIVVIGENPYAEFDGDIKTLDYQAGKNTDVELLKKLKADGIPVVTVFLTGRPLWVNPELNQSDAFVAAWLPGSAGQAVAEVLFKTASGEIQYDFKGKLPFSWPKTADQSPLNQGDPNYDPLFALGYGLSYQDKITVANDLAEQINSIQSNSDSLSLLDRRPAAGYSLMLQDEQGLVTVTGNKAKSADQSLSLAAVNWQKQEDALLLDWAADSKAKLVLQAATPLDASAYAQLVVDMKWNSTPTAAVTLAQSCGADCGGVLDLAPIFATKAQGQWHKVVIDLHCFAAKGVKLTQLQQAFVLHSAAAYQLSISNIRFTPAAATADLSCPAA
ncbi:glycoside hydrolase family 3 protein [Rheinheimera mesophila]|uniref:Glycoside hydrolase family 3 protein n=1 Tax=Rheinheimera mesophila TaxID=1547515 RepID=A0A3P3QGY2_9GAMM|nr:glycoside hydrolase family 3 protein [Rheinheimera mesophila]KKL02149.1 beta-glucosidase [Rheinheimera mesophila]RRJ20351.1 glycoside hydrolase family 3 protein [Rheinheimera mesophila]